jgi:hypothetical protein
VISCGIHDWKSQYLPLFDQITQIKHTAASPNKT